jgi:sugar lactone lactonase YvrE
MIEPEVTLTGFHRPFYAAPSPDGRLFVCDFAKGEVQADGFLYASLRGPHSVDWDKEGSLYICEYYGKQIIKCLPTRQTKVFLKDLPGPATAFFNRSKDVLYVTDFDASRVMMFDLEGNSLGELEGSFNRPHSCAFDHEDNIYVADTHHHQIQKFNKEGKWLFNFGNGRLVEPVSISVGKEFLYTSEYCSDAIKRFTLDGRFHDIIVNNLSHPYGIKIHEDSLYVADSDHACVKIFSIPQ